MGTHGRGCATCGGKLLSPSRERVLVAIASNGMSRVLHGKGQSIGIDMEGLADSLTEDEVGLQDLPSGFPKGGVFVIECRPSVRDDPYGIGPGSFDYRNEASWRRPTPEEAALVVAGDWGALDALWSDVPTAEQIAAAHPPSVPVEERPQVPRADKQGRNDPCACGSGKKHKRCCGHV